LFFALATMTAASMRLSEPVLAGDVAFAQPQPSARPGQACEDPTSDGGGELSFAGFGTPNHNVTLQADVCPAQQDVWTFSTFTVPLDQAIGIKITEKQGTVVVTLQRPDGSLVPLAPGEEYRAVEGIVAVTYRITVAGTGTGLASYRLQACRSAVEIAGPCQFSEEPTPDPIVQPPDQLTPPTDLSPPGQLSPPQETPTSGGLSPPGTSPYQQSAAATPSVAGLPPAGGGGAAPVSRAGLIMLSAALLSLAGAGVWFARRPASRPRR